MRNLLIVIVGLFFAVATNGCDGVEQVNSLSSKSLWSAWVSEDGSEEFDISDGEFLEWQPFTIVNDEIGEYCNMEIWFSADNASNGGMTIRNDDCGIYDGNYVWHLSGAVLSLCVGPDCYDYY